MVEALQEYISKDAIVDWDCDKDGILLHKFYFTIDENAERYHTSDTDIIDIRNWSLKNVADRINEILETSRQTYVRAKSVRVHYSGGTDPLQGFFLFLTATVHKD